MHPLPAGAQVAPQIIISEINWAGSSLSTADEWIKLYNAGPDDINASGFVLTGVATSGQALSLADGTMIPTGTSLLISNYYLGAKSILTEKPDLVTTALSLPNSGLHIFLTMTDGTVLDEVNFGSTSEFGSTDPFTPAVRDLMTLEWQTIPDSEPVVDVAEVVVADSNMSLENEITVNSIIIEEPIIELLLVTEIVTPEPILTPETIIEPPIVTETMTEIPIEIVIAEATIETLIEVIPTEIAAEAPVIEPPAVITNIPEAVTEPTPAEATEIPQTETESVTEPLAVVASEEVEIITVEEIPILEYSPNSIIINEIMSDPSDGVEWIELFNPGTESVDLTDWSITDATDKATILSSTIEAKNYFIIEAPKGKLNNDGDDVNLFDPSGALINAMSYGTADLKSPSKGQSLSLVNNTWTETPPTIAAANQEIVTEEIYEQPITALNVATAEPTILQETETEPAKDVAHISTTSTTDNRTINLAKPTSTPVKKLTAAKVITTKSSAKSSATKTTSISGLVTALPGTFGDQIMFIDGIQVYANNKDWPELSIGDVVTIKGTLSTSHGEQRIKIKTSADIKTTGHNLSTAINITSDQLANLPEGRLVTVEGTVTERTGDRLTLEDDIGTIIAVAYSKTGLTWLDLPSSHLKITGVVRHIDGEALLYPRDANDIEFVTDDLIPMATVAGSIDTESTASINWLPYLAYVLFGGTLSVLVFWFLRSIRNPKTVN